MGIRFDLATCVDCGTRRQVRHREWIHATQPRCFNCGGRIEPSGPAYEQHLVHNEAIREKCDEYGNNARV